MNIYFVASAMVLRYKYKKKIMKSIRFMSVQIA